MSSDAAPQSFAWTTKKNVRDESSSPTAGAPEPESRIETPNAPSAETKTTQPRRRTEGKKSLELTAEQIASLRRPFEERLRTGLSFQGRGQVIFEFAQEAFTKTGSWVRFYQLTLGPDGFVAHTFPDAEERQEFEETATFTELHEMLAALRSQDNSKCSLIEPEHMVTIRVPASLHQALIAESESLNLSINKLCITKMLQPVDPRYTPVQIGRRRGRKPGPQSQAKGKKTR